jgi:uncharacterized protein DUF2783
MSKLNTTPNIDNPDGFYEELLKLHEGMSEADSHALNARLVLILANHIGERDVLSQAMKLAKDVT